MQHSRLFTIFTLDSIITFIRFDDDDISLVLGVSGDALLEDEQHVEHGKDNHGARGQVERHEAVVVSQPGAQREPDAEPDGHEAVEQGEAPGPGLRGGDVRHVGVRRQVEAGGAARQVLQALQQQILHLELEEPDGVEEEDDVEQEVAEQGGEDERLAAELVAEGPRKQGEDDAGGALQHPVVRLDLADILLSLLLGMREWVVN